MLGHRWERAEATVVARTVRVQPAGSRPHYDFVVDVRPSSGPPVRVTIHDGPAGDFDDPVVGDVLRVLYDPKHQHVKWDLTDPWLVDAAADRRATLDALASGTLPGAFGPATGGVSGSVQYLDGAAASEMLGALFGPNAADTIAAMRASAPGHAAHAVDPAERLSRLRALLDSGVLTEAEYETQRQKIIDTI
jgi:Short C-terminal domain